MHPKMEAALKRKRDRDDELAQLKRNATLAMKHYGLRFVHIQPYRSEPGMTIAWARNEGPHASRCSTILVATALCHPNDEFSTKMGRWVSADYFNSGLFTTLRIPSFWRDNIDEFVRATFDPAEYDEDADVIVGMQKSVVDDLVRVASIALGESALMD